jgi:hypothetical protein
MFALVSLRGQTPSTRRIAPAPETRTLEKPKSRNFCAISELSANCSIALRARIARYRFPWWTVNSVAKLEALTKVAAMAKAERAVSELRRVLLVMANVLLVPLLEPAFGASNGHLSWRPVPCSKPTIHLALKGQASDLPRHPTQNKAAPGLPAVGSIGVRLPLLAVDCSSPSVRLPVQHSNVD